MDFHFGARVLGNEEIGVGELTRIVYGPEAWTIDFLIAESAHMGERELQVPLDVVVTTDDETVQLAISEDEFENLDEFSRSYNVSPPPDRDFADVEEEDEIAPGSTSPPVGAATGIESIAFVPIVEEDLYIPSGDGVLDRCTEVWATDGLAGNVRAVTMDDDSRRISAIVVRHGALFTHDVTVPVDLVESMRTDAVVLKVARSTVDAQHSS